MKSLGIGKYFERIEFRQTKILFTPFYAAYLLHLSPLIQVQMSYYSISSSSSFWRNPQRIFPLSFLYSNDCISRTGEIGWLSSRLDTYNSEISIRFNHVFELRTTWHVTTYEMELRRLRKFAPLLNIPSIRLPLDWPQYVIPLHDNDTHNIRWRLGHVSWSETFQFPSFRGAKRDDWKIDKEQKVEAETWWQ